MSVPSSEALMEPELFILDSKFSVLSEGLSLISTFVMPFSSPCPDCKHFNFSCIRSHYKKLDNTSLSCVFGKWFFIGFLVGLLGWSNSQKKRIVNELKSAKS